MLPRLKPKQRQTAAGQSPPTQRLANQLSLTPMSKCKSRNFQACLTDKES